MTTEARCQVCNSWVVLRKDETLYGHGTYDTWCPGSSQPGLDPRQRPIFGHVRKEKQQSSPSTSNVTPFELEVGCDAPITVSET